MTRRMRPGRFQQMVAVSMGENTVLTVDEETTSPPQLSSAYLEKFNGWIRCENEIFVGSNEHEDDHEGTTNNHTVGEDGNGGWGKHGAQIDPSTDRWC